MPSFSSSASAPSYERKKLPFFSFLQITLAFLDATRPLTCLRFSPGRDDPPPRPRYPVCALLHHSVRSQQVLKGEGAAIALYTLEPRLPTDRARFYQIVPSPRHHSSLLQRRPTVRASRTLERKIRTCKLKNLGIHRITSAAPRSDPGPAL